MFIELTEILRCPQPHEEGYLICAPVTMDGRDVVRGGLMCAVCRAEYPVLDRVAWFAPPDESAPGASDPSALTAEAAAAFLGLEGPGGYLLTVGSAGRLAAGLVKAVPGVAIAAVNAPADVAPELAISLLRSPRGLPVKRHSVRGVIAGPEAASGDWLEAAAGTLLTGLRMIVESETAQPPGVVELVRGAGVLVGERRST